MPSAEGRNLASDSQCALPTNNIFIATCVSHGENAFWKLFVGAELFPTRFSCVIGMRASMHTAHVRDRPERKQKPQISTCTVRHVPQI